MKKYQLKLYISGRTTRSEQAVRNLRRVLAAPEMDDSYDLTIIDLADDPQRAEEERILATPVLVKELPPPVRRVIGDLSNQEKLHFALDINRRSDQ